MKDPDLDFDPEIDRRWPVLMSMAQAGTRDAYKALLGDASRLSDVPCGRVLRRRRPKMACARS